MHRSLAILASAIACSDHASFSVTGNTEAPGGSDTIMGTANPANVDSPIPSSFMGLSIDALWLEGTFAQNRLPSTNLVNLLKTLGAGVMRINAGDYCGAEYWWTPGARDTRADKCDVLIGADFDRLFQILGAAKWTAIVGVNFAAALRGERVPGCHASQKIGCHITPRLSCKGFK